MWFANNIQFQHFEKSVHELKSSRFVKSIYCVANDQSLADFVNVKEGTGIVQCAPGHGADDYNLGIKYNIDIVQTVTDDGKYNEHAKGFVGEHIYKVDLKVAEKLKEFGNLLYLGKIRLIDNFSFSISSRK